MLAAFVVVVLLSTASAIPAENKPAQENVPADAQKVATQSSPQYELPAVPQPTPALVEEQPSPVEGPVGGAQPPLDLAASPDSNPASTGETSDLETANWFWYPRYYRSYGGWGGYSWGSPWGYRSYYSRPYYGWRRRGWGWGGWGGYWG